MFPRFSVSPAFTPVLFDCLRRGYHAATARADALSGLTVAIVALPLAMALAIASGATPDKGLITAVIAGFIISFLGGSKVQIGGPTGAFVVVIYGVIMQHGYDGLLLATLMAGVILVVAGYARLGQVITFMPHPVVTGFTAGIAVIIASSQIKDFTGLAITDLPADFIHQWGAYFSTWQQADLTTLALGLTSLGIIIVLRKIAPRLPGYLIAVVAASTLAAVFHLPVETIGSRFPDLPAGIPAPSLPEFSFEKMRAVAPSALVIAFLAGIEALLSALVADGMTGQRHKSNQELVGQGVANIASACCGGLPATGAIARTATSIKSGAQTPVAGMMHAVFLLFFMLAAMDVVAYIPLAALAAILFVVAWGMSEARHFVHILSLSAGDRAIMVITFLLTVLLDLTVAIGVGVTLSALFFMHQMRHAVEMSPVTSGSVTLATDDDDKTGDDHQRDALPAGVEVFRIAGPLFFAVANDLLDALRGMGHIPRVLILRMGLVPYLDASGTTVLETIIADCTRQGTVVILSGVQRQPASLLRRAAIADNGQDIRLTSDYAAARRLAAQLVADRPQA